ncbi:hypothetical protein [Xylanimonas oleitrophica]|nr:hypothetical protein [Xylanimonas oleitrophica]
MSGLLYGYDWLLNRAGIDPEKAEHAAHLDDQGSDPECIYCRGGAR